MITKYYATHDIHHGKGTVKKGTLIATLETHDEIPVDNVIRSFGNGLSTTTPPPPEPAPTTPATAAPEEQGK